MTPTTEKGNGMVALIVDDERDCQLLATRALEGSFELRHAMNLEEANAAISQGGIDLVLLDVSLPDGNGFDFCRQLKDRPATAGPRPSVILLTGRSEIDAKVAGFSAGADDYMTKPFDPQELLMRAKLRARPAKSAPQASSALTEGADGTLLFGDLRFDPKGESVSVTAPQGLVTLPLTQREFRLLSTLARAGGHILSRDQLIAQVWESESRITGRTVDTHICKLRRKMSLSRFTISSVYGAGYRIVAPAEGLAAG